METASPPSPCVASLEVIFVTLGSSVMNNCVDVLEVDPYTQSYDDKHNKHNFIWNLKTLEDDIRVVLICACVKHANQMIVCFLQ